jgi:hypothetical protein
MLFKGLISGKTQGTGIDLSETYMLSVHSISGSVSGESAHSTGWPSYPLKGISSSVAVMIWIVPSESPKAIYTPVGETAAELMKAGVSN